MMESYEYSSPAARIELGPKIAATPEPTISHTRLFTVDDTFIGSRHETTGGSTNVVIESEKGESEREEEDL